MKKKYYLFEMKGSYLNFLCILIIIIMYIITFMLLPNFYLSQKALIISAILIIPYLILHEFIHSIFYVIGGAQFKNVTYGAHLEKGILCCLCKQNITKANVLISLLSPFIIIGIFTYILGIVFSNSILIFLSILNISGCAGDLIMFLDLVLLDDFEYSEYDNPMAFGLYSKKDLSKHKMLGLKYIGSTDKLEKNDFKKISISKTSIVILLIFLGIIVLESLDIIFKF